MTVVVLPADSKQTCREGGRHVQRRLAGVVPGWCNALPPSAILGGLVATGEEKLWTTPFALAQQHTDWPQSQHLAPTSSGHEKDQEHVGGEGGK